MTYRDSHRELGLTYDANLEANLFDDYMSRWESAILAGILSRRFPQGDARALDFACGTGRITATLVKSAREVVGLDVSESMLTQAATKLPTVRFIRADITRDKVDLGSFDVVAAFRFFGNAEDALRREVLARLRASLAPSGVLILNNHRNPRSIASIASRVAGGKTVMDLSHGKLDALLRSEGFRVVERTPIGAWMIRASMMYAARRSEAREKLLESLFGSSVLSRVAPDSVLVARRS